MDLLALNSDLLNIILSIRSDLRDDLSYRLPEKKYDFMSWILSNGIKEYPALIDNPQFQNWLSSQSSICGLSNLQEVVWKSRPDLHIHFDLTHNLNGYKNWFYSHGITEHKLWNLLTPDEIKNIKKQAHIKTSAEYRKAKIKTIANKLGVNLIGHVNGQTGIGEDVRNMIEALGCVDMPLSIINFQPGSESPQLKSVFNERVVKFGNYAINIFCLPPLEHARFYAENGSSQILGRYNIGYWPWELSKWPQDWVNLINLVDEIWVSSQHTKNALLSLDESILKSVAIKLMPMAVKIDLADIGGEDALRANRSSFRKKFGLPIDSYLFYFAFDLNSSISRKNPYGVIQAFTRAFSKKNQSKYNVGLIIKAHKPSRPNASWDKLKLLSKKDKRIILIEKTLSRNELIELYKSCECFVSLHRAEGFGRNIAEALQLGLKVIATDYSGNVDFCRLDEFANQYKPVPYRLVKVKNGEYAHHKDQVWAEPNIEATIRIMENLVRNNDLEPQATSVSTLNFQPFFSPKEIGRNYLNRLKEIYAIMPTDGH